jgi:UDP-N-acetyl-D-mannosaminuronate dehydrogenase
MPTSATPDADDLVRRLDDHTARPAVLGLRYVGLPLAVEFASDADDLRESRAIDVAASSAGGPG